jgi:hypothetical protein
MGKNEEKRLVTAEMLKDLPEIVQRYMQYTGVLGKPWIHNVRLEQSGRFQLRPGLPWLGMKAVQIYTTDSPSYAWKARFTLWGLPLLRARDSYHEGRGHMFGRLAGLVTILDERGEKLDQGAMLRYLSEMIWFPIALLGDNISWQPLNVHSARVTFADHGKEVSGEMYFEEDGRLVDFTALRYRMVDGDYSLDAWSTPISAYGKRAGLNLPVKGQAVWNLHAGDMPYWDGEITKVEYNLPQDKL